MPTAIKRILLSIAALAIILASFSGGIFIGQKISSGPVYLDVRGVVNKEPFPLEQSQNRADFLVFWEAWKRLEQKFIDKEKIDPQKMIFGAVSGMVNSLGHPY